jgi:hypothetical protein
MKKKLLVLGLCLIAAAGLGHAADGDKTGMMVTASRPNGLEGIRSRIAR